ncbi:MAG: hypothetical protein JST00_23785 [Deltaproteobacteria bacterium]|nr:hypothetical protein [Deltaproteobacteria bacterium]
MSNVSVLRMLGFAITGLSLSVAAPLHAQSKPAPLAVTTIAAKPGAVTKVQGTLATGVKIPLEFASRSSVACFPSVRNQHFDGNHVLFRTSLPPASVMKIRAIPSRPDLDVSLYAYSTGRGSNDLPPNVPRVVACEASHGGRVSLSKPYNPGETEQVELNAIQNGYDVVIGVAGARGLTTGDFTVEVELSASAPAAPTGKITSATPIPAVSGKTVSVQGSIDGGVQIPLGFAAQSSVACFPGTVNAHYSGNQIAYSFDIPPATTAKIELVPVDSSTDLSLYAYSVGPSFPALPPSLSSVVSCEASPPTNRAPNPGAKEAVELVAIRNPYKAFVVVAGAQGAKTGRFTLNVTLSGR